VRKSYLAFIIFLVILLVSLGVYFFKKKNTSFLELKKGNVVDAVYGLGQVKSDKIFEVKIGIITNIKKLYVKEGSDVNKGDSIIAFDTGSIFKAPFDGTITMVSFQEGEVAFPQIPILRLENLENKYLEVSLEQEAALKVIKGQTAKVIFESLKTREFEGVVKTIFPKDGEFIAHILIDNLTENILPGMTADIIIEIGRKEDTILIPVVAITNGYVIRFRDDKKKKIAVKIGHSDGIWAELIKGDLLESDSVVIKVNK